MLVLLPCLAANLDWIGANQAIGPEASIARVRGNDGIYWYSRGSGQKGLWLQEIKRTSDSYCHLYCKSIFSRPYTARKEDYIASHNITFATWPGLGFGGRAPVTFIFTTLILVINFFWILFPHLNFYTFPPVSSDFFCPPPAAPSNMHYSFHEGLYVRKRLYW